MALTSAQIAAIGASLAAEPFTRQSVIGTAAERSYSAGLARGYAMAGQETDELAPAPTAPAPSPVVMTPEPAQLVGMETGYNGVAETNGITEIGDELDLGGAPVATPMGFPIIAGVMTLTVAAMRSILARFGPAVLKLMVGAAAFKEFWDIVTGKTFGTDDTVIRIKPGGVGRKRRYSIGGNPRVRTLQRVSRHCLKLIKRHDKIIKEFLPKRQGLPARALARTYLSTAERKALTN